MCATTWWWIMNIIWLLCFHQLLFLSISLTHSVVEPIWMSMHGWIFPENQKDPTELFKWTAGTWMNRRTQKSHFHISIGSKVPLFSALVVSRRWNASCMRWPPNERIFAHEFYQKIKTTTTSKNEIKKKLKLKNKDADLMAFNGRLFCISNLWLLLPSDAW